MPSSTWVAVVALYAASAAALNVAVVRHPDRPRPGSAVAQAAHPIMTSGNDTDTFLFHLERAADAAGEGRVYFPVSDFDCPPSFLLPCGAIRHVTGWNPVVILNGFALVVWVLNGVAAFGFLRHVGVAPVLAAVLGLAYQGSGVAAFTHHMAHMNTLQMEWVAAAFWATAGLCRPGAGWGWAAFLGLSVGMQVLSSPSYTLYLAFAGLPAFCGAYWLALIRRGDATRRDVVRFVGQGLAAAVLAGLVSAFYLVPRLAHPPHTFPPMTWLPYVFHHYLELLDPTHPTLFLGLPLFLLTILAANWWWANRTPAATACLAAAMVSAVMMTPALPLTPSWLLHALVPPVRHLRVPTRFFPLMLLNLCGLVGLYLTAVTPSRRRWLVAGGLLLALTAMNWLTSAWYYPVDPIPAVKRWLGKDG